MATVTEDVASLSVSEENDKGGSDTDNRAGVPSDDEAVDTDSDTPKEEEWAVCPSLRLDHRLQRTLFQFDDDDESEEAAADAQSLSQNLARFKDDMCGWVPDPSVQYRRQAAERQPAKAGGRTGSKLDGVAVSASRRLALYRNHYGHTNQQTSTYVDFEFKHFSNYKRYSEQYRRYHTCGGPLQKLTQSAFGGRPRTIYYAGDATAEAGVEVGSSNTRGGSQQSPQRSGPGGQTVRGSRVAETPNSTGQPVISYSDISVNSPRYNLLVEQSHRKNRVQYPSVEWAHRQPGAGPGFTSQRSGAGRQGAGTQPPGQWNVAMNEQTLTVYTSKPPGGLPPSSTRPATPPKPHLPFFPSQQPLRQLHTTRSSLTPPGSNPANDPLSNGFSLDRSLGTPAGCSTGISRNPVPHRDFYSQLMHAAHCLSLAAKSPKDFDFELPRWPTCTSHPEINTSTPSPQHASYPEKSASSSAPSSSSRSSTTRVQVTGRGVSGSPTSIHPSSRWTSRPCKQQQQQHQNVRKSASMYSLENPTSATTETHYITIEAPTCSPFDTRSALQAKRDAEVVSKATSYRVTLKEKSVVPDIKEKSSVDLVGDANRPLAVCEVTWF